MKLNCFTHYKHLENQEYVEAFQLNLRNALGKKLNSLLKKTLRNAFALKLLGNENLIFSEIKNKTLQK
jgi:hypothetical protein